MLAVSALRLSKMREYFCRSNNETQSCILPANLSYFLLRQHIGHFVIHSLSLTM